MGRGGRCRGFSGCSTGTAPPHRSSCPAGSPRRGRRPSAPSRRPAMISAIISYLHELFYGRPLAEQRDILIRCSAIFRNVAGVTPAGFRTPSGDAAAETFELLEELGIGYSSSMRGDDRPYRWVLNGRSSDLIEIPARWELDDFPQFGYNDDPPAATGGDRIASLTGTLGNWRREFDGYYSRGLCYVLIMHPQVIGTPGRMLALDGLLAHIRSRPGTWLATGSQIAQWWRRVSPP